MKPEPAATQWRAWQDGDPFTAWIPDGHGDRAGWEALAKRSPNKYRIEARDLYTVEALTEAEQRGRVKGLEEAAGVSDAYADEKDVLAMEADESNFSAYREGERTANQISTAIRVLAEGVEG